MRSFIISLLLTIISFGQPEAFRTNHKKLIESEIAFSDLCQQVGIKQSFLTYLTDDAIVFRPEPVKAKDVYTKRKENGALLKWKPIWAEISAAGDLGYTTGPWEFQLDTIKGWGEFVSVWQKQKDGNYKVLIDIGIDHEKINYDSITLTLPKDDLIKKELVVINVNDAEILAQLDSSSKSIESLYDNEVRIFRNGKLPTIGKENASDVFKEVNNSDYLMFASKVAQSGDLGYTYGVGKIKAVNSEDKPKQFSYLRIWKKKVKGWKIVLEVTNQFK